MQSPNYQNNLQTYHQLICQVAAAGPSTGIKASVASTHFAWTAQALKWEIRRPRQTQGGARKGRRVYDTAARSQQPASQQLVSSSQDTAAARSQQPASQQPVSSSQEPAAS